MAKDNKDFNKKNNKGKKSAFRDKMEQLEKVQRDIEREKKKIAVECAHQNSNSKLKIHALNDRGDYQCKICKSRFNMMPIKEADINNAIETLHNAIQQIRCQSDVIADDKLIRVLGDHDYHLQSVAELYERVTAHYGRGNGKKNNRNKNKNNDRRDDFGGYGSSNISFVGGGKR